MGIDHNDIYSIVERLRILEEGLDKNQKSVNQLSATFKPKTVAVLTAKTDPKNPLGGKLVGDSVETEEDPLEEAFANEDVLDKVKASFADYLKSVADEVKQDSDIKEKSKVDHDLSNKDNTDRDLIAKEKKQEELDEDPTQGSEPSVAPPAPIINPTLPESKCVKSITNECGLWEVHGNESDGFNIHREGRCMPSRFKSLDEAVMALEMFAARRAQQDDSADYIEEA